MAYKTRPNRRSSKPRTLSEFVSHMKRRRPRTIIFHRTPSAAKKKVMIALGYQRSKSGVKNSWTLVARKRRSSKAAPKRRTSRRPSSRRRVSKNRHRRISRRRGSRRRSSKRRTSRR